MSSRVTEHGPHAAKRLANAASITVPVLVQDIATGLGYVIGRTLSYGYLLGHETQALAWDRVSA